MAEKDPKMHSIIGITLCTSGRAEIKEELKKNGRANCKPGICLGGDMHRQ